MTVSKTRGRRVSKKSGMSTSPKPIEVLSPELASGETSEVDVLMDFYDALKAMYEDNDKKATRIEWNDEKEFLQLVFDPVENKRLLCIHKSEDDQFHPLKVSDGDLAGRDWKVTK